MKIRNVLRLIRALPASLRVNFRFLPFRQAIKLPIIIYKANLAKMGHGKIIVNSHIRFGLIKLGYNQVSIYPRGEFMVLLFLMGRVN